MGNFSGNNSQFQIGKETTWGTQVATTVLSYVLPFLSESLHETHNVVESEALVGAVTTPYFSIIGRKVEGDLKVQIHPDNFGLLCFAAMGAEAAVTTVTTGVYAHAFTAASGTTSLGHLTGVVDKKADVFVYTSLKVDSMVLETDPAALLMGTFTLRGMKEQRDQDTSSPGPAVTLSTTLTLTTIGPYDFTDMKMYTGTAGSTATTGLANGTKMTFTYANNLENDLFVADGTEFMAEIDYQKRDITFDVEMLYDAASNTMRESYFKTGTKMSFQIQFVSPSTIVTGQYYKITIDMLNVVVTEAPNDIGGPERLKIPMKFRALDVGSAEPVTITIQDGLSTKYSA